LGDVAVGEQPGLVDPRVELVLHGLVRQVLGPAHEVVHGALRAIAVVDLERVAPAEQLPLCRVQGLGGGPGEDAHRLPVAVDAFADEVVAGEVADLLDDRGVDAAQRDEVLRSPRFGVGPGGYGGGGRGQQGGEGGDQSAHRGGGPDRGEKSSCHVPCIYQGEDRPGKDLSRAGRTWHTSDASSYLIHRQFCIGTKSVLSGETSGGAMAQTRRPVVEGWFTEQGDGSAGGAAGSGFRLLGTRCSARGSVFFPPVGGLCRN